MTTTPTFHVRSRIPLGEPTNTTGTLRPKLRLELPWHTVHYTGIGAHQIAYSGGDGVFDTLEQVFASVRNLEDVARRSGKPFEYNTLIPVMRDPFASHIIAYADEYQAAHSAGENPDAHGTQFMVGVGQRLTPGAINAFRYWNGVLLYTRRLAATSVITPHRKMPGAATICPGPAIELDWPELVRVWEPTETEQPTEEDTMGTARRYKDRRYANEFLLPEGVHLSPALSASYQDIPLIEDIHEPTLDGLLHRNGLTRAALVP